MLRKQKNIMFLESKFQKIMNLQQSGTANRNAEGIFILQQRVSHPVQLAFAVQEGLIDLNEKLTEAFSGDLPECIDENLKEATVRDLLTMCLDRRRAV